MDQSKVFWVTGAASGIGRALAHKLYDRGHRLVVSDLDEEALSRWNGERESAEERVLAFAFDVRKPKAWERGLLQAKERFGRVDALLNVAGYLVPRWAHETTPKELARMVEVNVLGVMYGTRAVSLAMIESGGGHIVNVASLAALVPVPGLAAYSASKHAVRAFSIAVAQELKPFGIAATAVCPGAVQTPMLDVQKGREEAALTFSASRPLTVDEVVSAIVDDALVNRPLELTVTVPRSGQSAMARVIGAWPELSVWLRPIMTRLGKHNQRRVRRQEGID